MITNDDPHECPENWILLFTQVDSAKQLLNTLFQMANLLLLLASIVENAVLVQVYVWYTLAFVVLGLLVNIVDFVIKYKSKGTSCLVGFIIEVLFLFAVSQCLPLVDTYRKHIDGESSITS